MWIWLELHIFYQLLLWMTDYIKENIGIAFNPEVKPPIVSDTSLPPDRVILFGAKRWVANVFKQKADLLHKCPLDFKWRLYISAVKVWRGRSLHYLSA